MAPHAVYLSMGDEVFINFKANVFERNRMYGRLVYVIKKNFRVEIGYISQILENSKRDQMQNIVIQ
jgi:hypothetical protein